MMCEEQQALAALHAVGALEGDDLVVWQNTLAAGAPDALIEQAGLREAVVFMAAATSPTPGPLPADLRKRVLARVRATPQAPAPQSAAASLPPGFRFVMKEGGAWTPLPAPGGRCKRLTVNSTAGYAVVLMEMSPGGRLPEHPHNGHEEVYVLSGDLQTEGHCLKAGDFLHSDPGTQHHALYTEHGCTALLVVPLAPAPIAADVSPRHPQSG